MEELISNLSKSLGFFCNHVETSCDALKQSIQRRPIPLDSASSIFIQCLNRRVTKVTADVNLLESMSFGTVSFEELLGHCNEVYKSNQTHLLQLQDRLKSFGYLPGISFLISPLLAIVEFPTKKKNGRKENFWFGLLWVFNFLVMSLICQQPNIIAF